MLFSFATFFATACSKAEEAKPSVLTGDGSSGGSAGPNVTVTTIAGKFGDGGNAEDGNGAAARFWNPAKMVFDSRNNVLYVADGTVIRSLDKQNNVKTYLPLGILGRFNEIYDVALAPGPDGGTLYFTSKENDLWKISPDGAGVKAIKLADRIYGGNEVGPLNSADHFDGANGIATGANGEIYFFNSNWNTLRRITLRSSDPPTGLVAPFAGKPVASRSGEAWPYQNGPGEAASFGGSVPDIAADGKGNIYIADFRNDLVRTVTPGGTVSSLFQYKNGFGIDKDGDVASAEANRVTHVSPTQNGDVIFFTTYGKGGNNLPALRLVRPGKDVRTLVGPGSKYGDGNGAVAGLGTVGGIACTPDGKTIFISEPGNKVIRKVTIE